jgi:hypothetical protein
LEVIVIVSVGLAAWEVLACLTGLPKITDLAHTWPWGIFVWAWVVWLVVHLVRSGEPTLQVQVYVLYLIGSATWLVATIVLLGRELELWR